MGDHRSLSFSCTSGVRELWCFLSSASLPHESSVANWSIVLRNCFYWVFLSLKFILLSCCKYNLEKMICRSALSQETKNLSHCPECSCSVLHWPLGHTYQLGWWHLGKVVIIDCSCSWAHALPWHQKLTCHVLTKLPGSLQQAQVSASLEKSHHRHGAPGVQHGVLLPDAPFWGLLAVLWLCPSSWEETENQN